MSLTEQQLFAISATERVCSAVSLIGTGIIVVTFIASSSFRKPINRLVFYASWGNTMANIATLISQSGIHLGTSSFLCQFQAFLIQWFMPADALWTFAMACNVYLTFFHKYNSEQLRRLEWKYVVCCYGLPFIPAFVYFFIETRERGRIYGSAILWCWVALSWDYLRIALFYGPVWFIIFLTFAIYVRAGRVIYQKRRQLRDIGGLDSSFDAETALEMSFFKTTEIQVTSEAAVCSARQGESAYRASPTSSKSPYDPYSITIEAGGSYEKNDGVSNGPTKKEQPDLPSQRRIRASEANSAAWAYTKYAMLFFIALLVTWVPSTVNRVYALARPDAFIFSLNYASSFVLPLQGFWNSIIYVSISWPACKSLLSDIKRRCQRVIGLHQDSRSLPHRTATGSRKRDSKKPSGSFGNESTQELTI
ncbi:hypothetical protein ASPWEDRAFT_43129 [Aspergillus wentii DTO 134E9]|uniref:G-protein coupled receptors family 2 profile 2 domain-containing protein n=1 Tax=Aspergillus wentii DTO 134E9 TaxID=1073089 RepID=A0A1L9RDS6_ASPWE|nr:uncharacterized protein ASPWEDRAFT_43129 [Aspergillus wentii DTO 134E9]OJJ33072.1 hypothetical protein ASPWEDRAFT_43129 [Aspergillus wentii DTO 134E9]